MKPKRSSINNVVRKHLLTIDNKLRDSIESIDDYGRMTQPNFPNVKQSPHNSKMLQTQTVGMSTGVNTTSAKMKDRFMGKASGEHSIKLRNRLVMDPMTTVGGDTLSTLGEPPWPGRENKAAGAYATL